MKIFRTPAALLAACREFRSSGKSVGFVPTMGFLHEGHLSLVRRARRENDRVVASIFVNPLQFGPGEDYQGYPRAPRRDRALFRQAGVDLLFEPEGDRFYPQGFRTRVIVQEMDERLCGAFRPGHFTGVATVVMKLLAACDPDRLYLGRKDYQQALILARMAEDLNLAARVVICPTLRERDGLAMSSRNSYLTPAERAWAPALYRALRATAAEIASGRLRTREAVSRAVGVRLSGGPGKLQYADILSARDLSMVRPLRGALVLAAAYYLGRARLIDNIAVRAPDRAMIARKGR